MLGPGLVARAAPDGHTLGVLPEAALRIHQLQKLAFDPTRDFSFISHLAGYSFVVAVRSEAPWQSWQEWVAEARRKPGRFRFASAGQYSTMHSAMEELMPKAGLSLLHVPYKGEMDIVNALLSGQVDLAISGSPLHAQVQAGKARALLQWTEVRGPRYPQVPTLRDMGYGMAVQSPFGLVGPRGMQAEVIETLQEAWRRALEEPAGRAALERLDMINTYLDSAGYARFVRAQYAHQRQLIQRLGWQATP
ncbi:Tripartite tricarboxylate transporter family receptor [compost metagenome]